MIQYFPVKIHLLWIFILNLLFYFVYFLLTFLIWKGVSKSEISCFIRIVIELMWERQCEDLLSRFLLVGRQSVIDFSRDAFPLLRVIWQYSEYWLQPLRVQFCLFNNISTGWIFTWLFRFLKVKVRFSPYGTPVTEK